MIQLADIERAATRLQGQLLRTPCVAFRELSDISGAPARCDGDERGRQHIADVITQLQLVELEAQLIH